MKLGKSPGPSNVITEILKASPDHCSQLNVENKCDDFWVRFGYYKTIWKVFMCM